MNIDACKTGGIREIPLSEHVGQARRREQRSELIVATHTPWGEMKAAG